MPNPKKPGGPRPTLVKETAEEAEEEVIEANPREEVFDQIDEARDRQVAQFGNDHDDALPHERWVALAAQRLGDVARAADEVAGVVQSDRLRRSLYRYRTAWIELLATGTAAVEAHDRTLEVRMEAPKHPWQVPTGDPVVISIPDKEVPPS